MTNQAIVIQRTFDVPVSKVWNAITSKEEMKNWYFDLKEFRAEPGFSFQFKGGDETRQFLHLCEITDVVKEQLLSYTWHYEGYPGNSLLTFELTKEGDKTALKLTHSGVETFAQNGPDFQVESFNAGWTYIIHTSLRAYLEGTEK